MVSRSAAVCRVVVATGLVALVGLVVGAVAPRLVGFEGHVVASGSMQPRLAPGDVVLTREVAADELQPGQVLLFADPDRAGRLLVHRLVAFDAHGDLVTRGDANQSNDTSHVPVVAVRGQAQLRIPYAGLPTYWRLTGQWAPLGLTALLLAVATVFVTRGSRRDGRTRARPAAHRARPDGPRHRAAPTRRYGHRPGRLPGPLLPRPTTP